MPDYAYLCDTCGPFEVRRVFEQASAPQHCGRCQALAQRAFTVPAGRRSSSAPRGALEGEERSGRGPRAPAGRPMVHAHGHSHSAGGPATGDGPAPRAGLLSAS